MDLVRLRHVLAVARTGSFSRAAEEENITQPALSRSIAAFEQRHGIVLFDRGRSGARPTPAGELVIEQGKQLLGAASDLERSLRMYGKGEAGRVALGLGPMLASVLLPEIARSLLSSRPGLKIETVIRTPSQILPDLLADRVDLIVGHSWQITQTPGIRVRPVARLDLAVIVRTGHPLACRQEAGEAIVLGDLDPYPTANAVGPNEGGFGSQAGAFVCENFHILRDTVAVTDCTWLASPAFVARELASGSLVRLDIADMDELKTEIAIVTRQGRTRSPAALAVADEIEAMVLRLEVDGSLEVAEKA